MKKNYLLICLVVVNLDVAAQSVGIGTTTPHASAMLDIKNNTKGLLIPRTSSTSRIAIVNPAKGLLIYDTTTASFWFHNGSAWTQIGVATAANGWSLTGNADTDPENNFFGTTDNNPLRFKINNTWAGEIHPTSDNIFLGMGAGEFNTTAGKNIAIGTGALQNQSFDFGGETNNVAIGFEALTSNNPSDATNGISNTAVGSFALRNNTIGYDNTAMGTSALYYNDMGVRNTAIGRQALFSNTSGYENTATGYKALRSNEVGIFNTANGAYSLHSNTYGSENTAQGIYSLYSNSTGTYNSANGAYSLYVNTSGYANTASGQRALFGNTTASLNTAIGVGALEFQSFNNADVPWESNNVAVGFRALYFNSPTSTLNGINNTAVGTYALKNNTTGIGNTANGFESLFTNSIGSYNTANGYHSLYSNTSGLYNTASGLYSLNSNTTGHDNTSSGDASLYSNTTGYDNTANGDAALYSNTTGYFNVASGANALSLTTTGAYNTALGGYALRYNIGGYQNIAIGYNSGTHASFPNIYNTVSIGNDGMLNAFQNQVFLGNNSTQFIGGKVNWGVVSDARIKNTVIEDVKGLDFILRLRPVTYHISNRAMTTVTGNKETPDFPGKYDGEKTKYSGFIAQEVEKAAIAANYEFSGYDTPKNQWGLYTIKYAEFVVPLVKAVQEQQSIIEDQNKKIELLLKEMQLIKEQLNKLADKSK